MNDFILFSLLGLGVGSLYALAAQGLVVIYRGSGVLNFAQAAFAMVGAYVFYELNVVRGVAYGISFIAAVASSTILGVLLYLLVLRRLRNAAPLMRIVATLALLITVQGIATVRYGATLDVVPSKLSQNLVTFSSKIAVPRDRLVLLAIAVIVTAILFVLYRFTRFGRATTAVAESERAAACVGLSPNVIATYNWALGSALAAVAALLIAPVVGLSVAQLTSLALASLAAALVGGFVSFPLTLLGGLAIGVIETQVARVTSVPGLPSAAPLLIIIVILVVTGRSLPLRDFFLQRQPTLGTGRIRPSFVAASIILVAVLILALSGTWDDAFAVTFSTGIVILSVVVLTGYAGQLSLAQWALAGVGALIASRLVSSAGWGFLPATVVAIAASAVVGALFAIPAVRTRGVNLAIITLSLGSAVELMVFDNLSITKGGDGIVVGSPHILGLNVGSTLHPARWSLTVFVFFLIAALAVANLRRGRVGRRMLAVRANERAAAALGISVPLIKLYAFALAAGIAALGGVLYGFHDETIVFDGFPNSYSITLVGFAVIGGVGWVAGSALGGQFATGALGAQIIYEIWPSASSYIESVSGVALLLIIALHPDGIAEQASKIGTAMIARLKRPRTARPRDLSTNGTPPVASGALTAESVANAAAVSARPLRIEGLTVGYGSVVAVADVSLGVKPGEVVGLIGANGAGKTSLIDAVSGFTAPRAGKVYLGGEEVTDWRASRRARAGLSRSFQALELFEDMTVADNLRTAYEPHDVASYAMDLVYPRTSPAPATVARVVQDFRLGAQLDRRVEDLPYGTRRLLAVARAVATGPSVVLLDEPAAGLSESETSELGEIVRALAYQRGIGVLLVEHDVNFVMTVCDRVVVIDFGKKIAEGSPQEIRNDARVIQAYLGVADDALTGAQTVPQ